MGPPTSMPWILRRPGRDRRPRVDVRSAARPVDSATMSPRAIVPYKWSMMHLRTRGFWLRTDR